MKSLANWCVPSMTEFIYELLQVDPSLTRARPSSVGYGTHKKVVWGWGSETMLYIYKMNEILWYSTASGDVDPMSTVSTVAL